MAKVKGDNTSYVHVKINQSLRETRWPTNSAGRFYLGSWVAYGENAARFINSNQVYGAHEKSILRGDHRCGGAVTQTAIRLISVSSVS